MTLSEAQIRELVERARAGNRQAVDSLIGGLRDRMLRWAVVVTGDVDDAEDVAQQAAMKLHKELGQFQSRARFSTWLYSVVRNTALDWCRTRGRRASEADVSEVVADATSDAIDRLHDKRMAELLRSYFRDLPPRQRELIELVDQQGFSAVEAAASLGIDDATARVHLMKARRTLRARMIQHYEAE